MGEDFGPTLSVSRVIERYARKLEDDIVEEYDLPEGLLDGEVGATLEERRELIDEIDSALYERARRLERRVHAELNIEVPDEWEVTTEGGMSYRLEDSRGTRKMVASRGDERYEVFLSGRVEEIHPEVYAFRRLVEFPEDLEAILSDLEEPGRGTISQAWTRLGERGVRDGNDELTPTLSRDAISRVLDSFVDEYWGEFSSERLLPVPEEDGNGEGPEPYTATVDYAIGGTPVITNGRDEVYVTDMNGVGVDPEDLEGERVRVEPLPETEAGVRLLEVV